MKDESSSQLYTFWSDGQLFAVPSATVKEVKDHSELTGITPIPHASENVAGYINIRGEVHLALDFRKMLGVKGDVPEMRDLIIFKEHVGPSFGILVDRTGSIMQTSPAMIESWEQNAGSSDAKNSFTSAICKQGEKLISILAPDRFLSA